MGTLLWRLLQCKWGKPGHGLRGLISSLPISVLLEECKHYGGGASRTDDANIQTEIRPSDSLVGAPPPIIQVCAIHLGECRCQYWAHYKMLIQHMVFPYTLVQTKTPLYPLAILGAIASGGPGRGEFCRTPFSTLMNLYVYWIKQHQMLSKKTSLKITLLERGWPHPCIRTYSMAVNNLSQLPPVTGNFLAQREMLEITRGHLWGQKRFSWNFNFLPLEL